MSEENTQETVQTTQSVDEMIASVTKQLEDLRDELLEAEKNFNFKKEQFVRLQGALEAFQAVKANS